MVATLFAGAVPSAQQPAAGPATAKDVPRINQSDFRARLEANAVLVVDVRDEVAFKSGHIPGAIHAPAKDIARQAPALRKLAGDRVVVAYCSCAAEQSAAEAGLTLVQLGFPRVAALVGGSPDWVHNGGRSERGP